MRPRAVLDTSVLLDAERPELLFAARRNLYTIVWSAFIAAEFARVRMELAFKHRLDPHVNRERINEFVYEVFLRGVTGNYTRLQGGNYERWLQDRDDVPVLATALVGKAQYIVSWNTKHFPSGGSYADLRYLTPRTFLDELYSHNPNLNLPDEFASSGYKAP